MSDLDKVLDQLVAGDEASAKETFHNMLVQQSRDEWNKLEPQEAPQDQPVQEAVDKSALQAWYDKYNKYMGNNGDKLADGFFEAYLDTGILTDATETNEFAKAVDDVFGGDTIKAEEELFGNEDLKKKHLPITYAMHDEFEKIMGAPVGATSPEDMEDNVTKAAKILGIED